MILQALTNYYDRKSADPDGGIAPEGFEYKEIPFVIVLNEQGDFVQIEDNRYQYGKQIRAKTFLVPKAEKRTAGVKANLLWDTAEYILGISVKSKPERVLQQHEAFIARILGLKINQDIGISAVLSYLSNRPIDALEQSNHAKVIKEINPFMAFRLNTENHLVCERKNIIEKIISSPVSGISGICLISGERDFLVNLQPPIKGISGANTTGANIVSFNHDSFNSFGKSQGSNAQIGVKSSFYYTTALNHLLGKDSKQKIQIDDTTTVVFWSQKQSCFESDFSLFFDEPIKDDPDRLTDSVKVLFNAVDSGVLPVEDNNNCFFILGISPNDARLSIRFWHVGTIAEFSVRIAKYFRDLELVHAPYERDYLSIRKLLKSIALLGKSKNIPPNLAGDWMRCILADLPYPASLFQAVLRRINAEREVNYPRASILKACLNRKSRFHNHPEEITVSLDKENISPGYRLGRVFAALEKIQEEANPGINTTIRDRYYSAASGTPASVMPILMRLKNHHLAKLEKGKNIYFERLLGEILSDLAYFPSQLNLQDQGRFAIGYYHQRQAFYIKSENSNQEV